MAHLSTSMYGIQQANQSDGAIVLNHSAVPAREQCPSPEFDSQSEGPIQGLPGHEIWRS